MDLQVFVPLQREIGRSSCSRGSDGGVRAGHVSSLSRILEWTLTVDGLVGICVGGTLVE